MKTSASGSVELLTDAQRQQLARMATVERFPARTVIYRAGTAAHSAFIISDGAVKSFRDLPSGRRRIMAFMFAGDLFGLAEDGRYVNTLQAMTAVTTYRIAFTELVEAFERDSGLELQFLCKVAHEIREAQHHTIIVGRRRAAGRLAMLLRFLERHCAQPSGQEGVPIPMTRSDMADYLGLSLEAVVRASRRLELQGIVDFPDRHHARILDHRQLEALASAV